MIVIVVFRKESTMWIADHCNLSNYLHKNGEQLSTWRLNTVITFFFF